MADRVEDIGHRRVIFFSAEGAPIAASGDANDFLSETWAQKATVAVLPVSRLTPDFLQLRTRLAGEVIQKFVNYQVLFVIVGDTSAAAASSGGLRDFIYDSNRGKSVWFLESETALRERLR